MFLLKFSAVFLLVGSCCLLSGADRVVTCDPGSHEHRLQCGYGLIRVQKVEAGHLDSEVCVNGRAPAQPDEPLCSMKGLLKTISKRCNGRNRCKVTMDTCHLARPCRRRCHYMATTYTCVHGRSHRICQKKKTTLHCGSMVIKVLRANYGRTSKKPCPYKTSKSRPPSTSCRQAHTLKEMTSRCDGKHRCSVRASNHIFSNPCPGTLKYLEYSYICMPTKTDDTSVEV